MQLLKTTELQKITPRYFLFSLRRDRGEERLSLFHDLQKDSRLCGVIKRAGKRAPGMHTARECTADEYDRVRY